jgi:hypothetical protein
MEMGEKTSGHSSFWKATGANIITNDKIIEKFQNEIVVVVQQSE